MKLLNDLTAEVYVSEANTSISWLTDTLDLLSLLGIRTNVSMSKDFDDQEVVAQRGVSYTKYRAENDSVNNLLDLSMSFESTRLMLPIFPHINYSYEDLSFITDYPDVEIDTVAIFNDRVPYEYWLINSIINRSMMRDKVDFVGIPSSANLHYSLSIDNIDFLYLDAPNIIESNGSIPSNLSVNERRDGQTHILLNSIIRLNQKYTENIQSD